MDDLVREQRARVNLGFSLGEAFQKSTAALFVISEKRFIIDEVCSGRNRFVFDLAPLFGGHFLLDYIEIAAQFRKSLAVILLSEIQSIANNLCISTGIVRRSARRRKPFC